MKRWLFVSAMVLAAGGALYYSERHKIVNRVGPEAVLTAAAEVQKEVSHPAARIVRLSDQEEIEVGNSLAQRYVSGAWAGNGENEQVEKYVNTVGRHVAARAHRKFDYKFHYIPDASFINAFALPGGQIFIGKGLMALMDTEDQLAGVLGHEVEHADHYDCNERVALRNLPFGELLQLPIALFQAGYSKEQEMEADRDGTALAVMAGYSPQGAVRMFQTFERLNREYVQKAESPQEELSQVAIQTLEGYFRSHPLPLEREHQIQALIISEKWPERKERPLKVRVEGAKAEATKGQ
ncbi:MAG TPA: M48 family metallopeptidase [Candidatus Angelobacter sp.]|nr:M48 family metallopeptidase [Candidatus Angelobacter sp.]